MKAQWLYDFQESDAIFSGDDLREFFKEELGNPCPSGYEDINGAHAARFVANCFFAARHNSSSLKEEFDKSADKWQAIMFGHAGKMPPGEMKCR